MAKRAALNVSLTFELVASVAARVGSGRYSSGSEVVRTGLRFLKKQSRCSTETTVLIGTLAPMVSDAS